MININLLPWREEQTKINNRLFGFTAVVIVFCCSAVCFLASIYVKNLATTESNDVALLSNEINMLESKINQIKGLQEQQNLLLSKRDIIQSLQASRPFIVQVFKDIVRSVPEGVFLFVVTRKDTKLILEGVSSSNSRIAIFLRNLQRLKWLQDATLQEIKTSDDKKTNSANTKVSFSEKNKQIIFKLQGNINN